MPEFLYTVFLNNTILNYLIVLIALILSIVVIRIITLIFLRRLSKRAKKSQRTTDDFLIRGIRKQVVPILYFMAFYLCIKILNLDPTIIKIIDVAVLFVCTVLGALFVSTIVVLIFRKYWKKKNSELDNSLVSKLIGGIIKTVIWIIAIVLFLDNIGVKITSIVAGMGIGGIAIAFAAQSILSDIFCYFTIFFDRPFEIGDFIISGTQMGTVEHIGVKTTRLRSLGGEELIFSNADLTSSRISNYKSLQQRRVLFTIGVTYDTPLEKLKEIPGLIKDIISSIPETTFTRTHFFSYAASSLNFEIVYFVLSDDYDKYMDIHQELNLKIKEEFEKHQIQFAFPTQTVHIQSSDFITGLGNH